MKVQTNSAASESGVVLAAAQTEGSVHYERLVVALSGVLPQLNLHGDLVSLSQWMRTREAELWLMMIRQPLPALMQKMLEKGGDLDTLDEGGCTPKDNVVHRSVNPDFSSPHLMGPIRP